MTSALPVTARGLSKVYPGVRALDGVDLDIEPGEVFALLGPNGAGKTTLVEILEGYRQRTAGEVAVLGIDPERGDAAWKSRLGIVLQTSALFEQLTVEEVIGHFAGFYPEPQPVERVIALVGLEDKRKARCRTLSGGQKRRVDVALGLVGNPDLIFLDEPTTGFDPAARRQAWDVVRGLTGLGKTVLLTTHYLDEAEALADRVGVIVAGKLVEVGTPRAIGGRSRGQACVTFRREGVLTAAALPAIDAAAGGEDGIVQLQTNRPTMVVRELAAWAAALGVDELPELEIVRPSLEDVYLDMIAAHDRPATADGQEHG